ncbi:MAG: amidase family protein [Thermodesulfobacteriota bacterium]|nr:amidase family protein [Thermodesulfobacteriota bacterium]
MNSEIFTYVDSSPSSIGEGGPLAGKTIAIQPNMSVSGWPTEAGSVALEHYIALEDATVVERLRSAGATITGSTRMSELGFGLMGDTASQAVAAGEVDIALITDTMGEARVAASATSIFGFKPSYGIVSRFGLIGLIPSMECYGILAKTHGEIASIMDIIAGRDDKDLSMPDNNIPDSSQVGKNRTTLGTLGVIRECIESLGSAESKAFNTALSRLKEAGLMIEEISLADFNLFRAVHNVIGSVEASSSCGKYDGVRYGHRTESSKNWNEMYLKSRAESFGSLVKSYLFQGAYFQFENYAAFENACRVRARLQRKTEELYRTVDMLILPAGQTDSLRIDNTTTINEVYDIFPLTLVANVTGQPAIHIPGSLFGKETDPGLQFMAPRLGDARLLALADILTVSAQGGE